MGGKQTKKEPTKGDKMWQPDGKFSQDLKAKEEAKGTKVTPSSSAKNTNKKPHEHKHKHHHHKDKDTDKGNDKDNKDKKHKHHHHKEGSEKKEHKHKHHHKKHNGLSPNEADTVGTKNNFDTKKAEAIHVADDTKQLKTKPKLSSRDANGKPISESTKKAQDKAIDTKTETPVKVPAKKPSPKPVTTTKEVMQHEDDVANLKLADLQKMLKAAGKDEKLAIEIFEDYEQKLDGHISLLEYEAWHEHED